MQRHHLACVVTAEMFFNHRGIVHDSGSKFSLFINSIVILINFQKIFMARRDIAIIAFDGV